MSDRVPPNSIQSEACVLGSMMLAGECHADVFALVGADDFYRPAHRVIFGAIADLAGRGSPADLVTMQAELERRGELAAVGGIEYVAALVEGVPTHANAGHYSQIVRDMSTKRRMIVVAGELYNAGFDGAITADELLEQAQQAVYGLDTRVAAATAKDMLLGEAAAAAMAEAEAAGEAGTVIGANSGIPALDAITGGLRPGEIMTLGGRTGGGKSTLAYNYSAHIAKAGGAVVIVSGEMPPKQMAKRFLQAEAEVGGNKLRGGRLGPEDWDALNAATIELTKWRVLLIGRRLTVPQIAAMARRASVRWRQALGLVVIDYIQIMQSHQGRSRYEQTTAMSEAVKALAMDLEVPVLSISQFGREAVRYREGQAVKPPTMHDLKESGSLENDSDFVVLLHKPEPERTHHEFGQPDSIEVWLRVAKGRETGETRWPVEHGEQTGGIVLKWYPGWTKFKGA